MTGKNEHRINELRQLLQLTEAAYAATSEVSKQANLANNRAYAAVAEIRVTLEVLEEQQQPRKGLTLIKGGVK